MDLRSSRPFRPEPGRRNRYRGAAQRRYAIGVFLIAALQAVAGCSLLERDKRPAPQGESEQVADLQMGYSMLADALSDESRLEMLELFKTVTLDAPSDRVSKLVEEIAAVSEKRAAQLEKLRALPPDVSGKPPTSSKVGDAIRTIAEEIGKDEMLAREGDFDTRFLVLQAQATRMVAAMSKAIARFDPNEKRVKWLLHVAEEYEGLRNELIAAIRKRSNGE